MSFIQRDQRRLHYQLFKHSSPHAPLVVYMHGLLMDNLSSGYFTFTHKLKEEAHILLFDLVGHGRSSFVDTGYRLDDHIKDLRCLISNAEVEISKHLSGLGVVIPTQALYLDQILIGCSFGGTLALHAATKLKTVRSVVLLEGHVGTPQFLDQLREDLSATGDQAASLISKHFKHWLHRKSERKKTRLLKRSERLVYESSLREDLRKDVDQSGSQPSIHLAILYIYGALSDAFSPAHNHYLTRQDQGAQKDKFKLYSNHSHALLWEQTADITELLVAWVKANKYETLL